jgi:predicted ArsR family transcriptional regulator
MAQQVHDPQLLRAIAHPVRNRILAELTAGGSLRAADVAHTLGIPANQASFHLRQLAKYGLVEEDPAAARDRRDRVWRAVEDSGLEITVRDFEDQPGGKAAARVFMRSAAAWSHHVVDQAYGDSRTGGTRRTTSEQAVRLTQAEAAELSEELTALTQRWVERTRGRDDERLTYLVHTMLLPYPDVPGERP